MVHFAGKGTAGAALCGCTVLISIRKIGCVAAVAFPDSSGSRAPLSFRDASHHVSAPLPMLMLPPDALGRGRGSYRADQS